MKKPLLLKTLLAASFVLPTTVSAHAQTSGGTPQPPPPPAAPAPPATAPAEKTVTLDVHDGPVRQVLTQLFDTVKVDYSLDNAVSGFVTLKVTDQPFENVLRLILRSSSVPLTYTRTNGVYEIKPRPAPTAAQSAPPAAFADEPATLVSSGGPHLAVIQLTYLDPYDIQGLLGITLVPSGSRGGGSGTGSPTMSGGPTFGGGFGNGSGIGTLGGNGTGGRLVGGGNNGTPGGGARPGR